jgi:tripartite-type tricarboxylate transporter receptor subunit TctC
MIVPFDAGGAIDQTARQLATAAETTCGTQVFVTNQPGSSGAVGFQAVANAQPNGYTVGLATVDLAIINHFGVSPITPEDVRGVMQYNFDPATLTVAADSPYTTIDDFLSAAQEGQTLCVGTSGTGSIWHISYAGMAQEAEVPLMTNVKVGGADALIAALVGGQVEATSGRRFSAPQIESGDLRPLVVMSEERLSILPDTPTLQEEGIDWSSGSWRGLVVPKDTPDEQVQALNDCFREAYESPEFTEFMKTQGFGMEYRPAEEFDAFMSDEYQRFGELVESLGLREQLYDPR